MKPGPIRVLIVDDEPLARTAIRNMLRRHPEVEIAAECETGVEAIAAIESAAPDLVFLDIQMPEVDGFGVLEAIGRQRLPRVIFVTAYDQYAVRAFEVHALDYLLKPFDRERFDAALDRARKELAGSDWNERVLDLLREQRGEYLQRLIIRAQGRVFFLSSTEIDWIEAQGNYVNVHGGGARHLFREAIGSLEAKLDPRKFRRIHRSTIVNIDAIRELRPCFHGDYEVVLRDGTELRLSHRFRGNLEKDFLGAL
ncbi:MAG TPA: LytTR family DNA-binding domain-containing protein [Bryobacteraceae bacterium]|nr:LytTR family DNA-binding domain-containing protein [Bryobacteraceae bacterium]